MDLLPKPIFYFIVNIKNKRKAKKLRKRRLKRYQQSMRSCTSMDYYSTGDQDDDDIPPYVTRVNFV